MVISEESKNKKIILVQQILCIVIGCLYAWLFGNGFGSFAFFWGI